MMELGLMLGSVAILLVWLIVGGEGDE